MEHQTVQRIRQWTSRAIQAHPKGLLVADHLRLSPLRLRRRPLPRSACVIRDIGIDDPWLTPELRFSVDEGLQGGYHIDVSVKAVGTLDPDSVNILELDDCPSFTDDWL